MSTLAPIDSQPTTVRPRILIVEDEAVVAMDLEQRLDLLGYELCGRADTADDAVRCALQEQPALVLMDIQLLGGKDGIDAARRIRAQSNIPIVFVTAHADDSTLARAGFTEPFGYVLKPFDERELKATVEMALYRSRAEQRLRSMERWLATTLGSIGDGVIATDAAGKVTFINPVAEALTGWTRAEAIGREFYDVFVVEKEGVDGPLKGLLDTGIREGGTIHLEAGHFLCDREGNRFALDDSIAPIRDEFGKVTGCVAVFRDVTARRRAEEERRRLEERMREAQRLESLGMLASGIAHDFNNLLHAILGNASLAQMLPGSGPKLQRCLSEIVVSAQRASFLSNQMLAYSGKGAVEEKSIDLSMFTLETSRLLQSTVPNSASIRYDLAPDLPLLTGDRAQLQQVIVNLVTNATEALDGKPGQVTVRTREFQASRSFLESCSVGSDLPEGNYLSLEVIDSGPGIPHEALARIFDPFYSTKFAGRGLGLAAVMGIVRAHHGALSVESATGQGAAFQILLPASANHAPAAPAAPSAGWKTQGRALIVEDEPALRLLTSALLRQSGMEVDTAEDGQAGLEAIEAASGEYKLILLDLTMPRVDGATAFRAIRARYPDLPVILMSGYSENDVSNLLRIGGPTDFLQKPFAYRNLLDKIVGILSVS